MPVTAASTVDTVDYVLITHELHVRPVRILDFGGGSTRALRTGSDDG